MSQGPSSGVPLIGPLGSTIGNVTISSAGSNYGHPTLSPLTTAQVAALTKSSHNISGILNGSQLRPLNINSMMNRTKIGFIGLGFVGSAIANAYDDFDSEVIKVDPQKGFTNTYKDLLGTDGVFVCVPSPMRDDGTCNTSILEDVLDNLRGIGYNGVIISKVTAPPQVYERLEKIYPNLVHAPEFLTAANASMDYARSPFTIIGGGISAYRYEAERIIKLGLRDLKNVIHCTIAEASLAKYTINCFLSSKVIFMNEMAKLAENLGCDYDKIASMVVMDERIGKSHMRVPGPDGAYGFGGMCFPKDTAALLKFAEDAGTDMQIINAAVKKNTLLRLTEPK